MTARVPLICACTLLIGVVPQTESKRSVQVVDVMDIEEAWEGEITGEDFWESDNMVGKGIRLGPGAQMAEHHHPVFDESLIVYSGKLTVWINGNKRELISGQIAYIPAGTVISATNETADETIVVATWASIGRDGPLTVPGKPKGD